jgi:hypothetical protein
MFADNISRVLDARPTTVGGYVGALVVLVSIHYIRGMFTLDNNVPI